jgi:hypothetical protein
MATSPPRPIPDSYWVIPGRLLAGEYPGHPSEEEAVRKLHRLLEAGVTCFVDLTEVGEHCLAPYASLLAQASGAAPVQHLRMAIRDAATPSEAEMVAILDAIDAQLAAGEVVYVHCYGGIGRTGTVVGCHLARDGGAAGFRAPVAPGPVAGPDVRTARASAGPIKAP